MLMMWHQLPYPKDLLLDQYLLFSFFFLHSSVCFSKVIDAHINTSCSLFLLISQDYKMVAHNQADLERFDGTFEFWLTDMMEWE